MPNPLDIKDQKKRVHELAQLGGLVCIAELAEFDKSLLLGALLDLSNHLKSASVKRLNYLITLGKQTFLERKSASKSFKSQEKNIHNTKPIQLSTDEIKSILIRLNCKVPLLEKDVFPELKRLLRCKHL